MIFMGNRCGCRATAAGNFGMELLVDGERSFGNMTTNINICPTCTPVSSSIFIEYDDISGASAQFTFMSIAGGVDFPECTITPEGGISLTVNAEGTLTGVVAEEEFIGANATLQLSLNESTNEMCITILVENHTITGCRVGGQTIEITNC
jgi:hypothetical protein